MAEDYLAAGRMPPLRIKIAVEQPCSGCGRPLFMPLLPAGGKVACPDCGARLIGQANLNEPLPLGEGAGLIGMAIPPEMQHLSLGQVLAMFEDRINEDYRPILALLQTGGGMMVQ